MLFLCENNLYAMGTALARHQAQTDIARKARGVRGVPGEVVDGMDVLAVEAATRRAAEAVRARAAGRVLLERRTYRFRAHSMYDPELYRAKDEVERWKARDPIALFAARAARPGAARRRGARRRSRRRSAAEIDERGRGRRGRAVGAGRGSREGRLHRPVAPMTKMTYREAVRRALREALRRIRASS